MVNDFTLQHHASVVAAFSPLECVVLFAVPPSAAASPSRSTAIRSSRRWPPHRELLVALQYHLLNHQSLENGLGRESFLMPKTAAGSALRASSSN